MLEWGTLMICGVVALVRLPDALHKRNRTVFGIMFLATLCSFLSVPGPYDVIDGALGGRNLTNLILRLIVFGMVFLVGLRLARGLGAVRARRLLAGPVGRWTLAVACLAVAATFLLMDTRGSSVGLQNLTENGRNAALAPLYAAAGRSYPALVSLVLLPPLLATVGSSLPRLVRTGAVLTFVGAVAAIVTVPASFAPDDWDGARMAVNYLAVLGYVLGLLFFWFSGRISRPPDNAPATLREK